MARRQIEILECDNPACGKGFEMGGDPVLGIHLSGGIIHEGAGGGSFGEVFACSDECLAPAVRHSYHRTAFPEVWDELQARYNAPGGILPQEERA